MDTINNSFRVAIVFIIFSFFISQYFNPVASQTYTFLMLQLSLAISLIAVYYSTVKVISNPV